MNTIDGITISDLMYTDIQAYKASGRKVVLSLGGEESWGVCTNCNDAGFLFATIIMSGPYKAPPLGKHCTNMNSGWYEIKDMSYDCPVCMASGNRPDVIATMLDDCGLEPEETAWRLDYLNGIAGKEMALAEAGEMLATIPSPNGMLLLFGDYGVGKSGVLKCMTSTFVRAGVKAKYMRASDILASIRSSYDSNTMTEDKIMQSLQRYGFLAIDEIDRIPSTEWAMATLFTILDRRYNTRLRCSTALATNLMPDNMSGDWEYLSSRLMDGRRVPVGGISFRGTQPQLTI
jgi:hypothetical protein